MKKQLTFFVFSLLLMATVISCNKTEVEQDDTLKVLGMTEKVGNYGYKELNEATVRWFFGLPADNNNPLLDETGAVSKSSNQPLPGITILPSNFGGKTTRSLTFSASNYVFLTPLGRIVWYYDNDACDPTWKPAANQSLKDFLFENVGDGIAKGIVSVKLDGVEIISDWSKFRYKTDIFELSINKDFDNPNCDYSKQKAKTVSDSYSVLLKIPKGNHVLIMKGTMPAANPADTFEAEVTWNLTVE